MTKNSLLARALPFGLIWALASMAQTPPPPEGTQPSSAAESAAPTAAPAATANPVSAPAATANPGPGATAHPAPAPAAAPMPSPKPEAPKAEIPKPVTSSPTPPTEPEKRKEKTAMRRLKRVLALIQVESDSKPLGTIKIQLHVDKTPLTAENFIGLAEGTKSFRETDSSKGKVGEMVVRPYYDGLTFHRVVSNYVIQGGCPLGTGRGGPGYTLKPEIHPDLRHSGAGVVAMATSSQGTHGSQFYITLDSMPHLDGKYTIFGRVIEGMDIVRKISQVKHDPLTEKPLTAIVMKKVSIVREYLK